MMDTFNQMTGLEKFFALCAFVGGIIFLFRLVLQFIGGDTDMGDMDADLDLDMDMDIDGDFDGGDTDLSFKVLSLQGITSFFMMFGLVGLALLRQSKVDPSWAILGAFAAGCGTVWVMKKIYISMKSLQSSGTIKMKNALGQEGTVYLTIPNEGTGKVQISIQDHLKVFEAVSDPDNLEIKTGQRIKVVRIVSNNILVVQPIG